MSVHVYYLRFRAPVTELPRAPALWGHLAWAERWHAGEAKLKEFLNAFATDPPFLISSAFPVATAKQNRKLLLPRPKLPPILEKDSRKRKALKRIQYLTCELFKRVAELGEKELVEAYESESYHLEGNALVPSGYQVGWTSESRVRVGIDRSTGAHASGILFADTAKRLTEAVVYVDFRLKDYGPSWFEERLREVGRVGFGGKKSVGYGVFELEAGGEERLPQITGANAYTLLSPALPLSAEGWYAIEPYWGRLGEHYALAANPFKRIYYRAVEGSTFRERPAGAFLDVTPEPPPEEGVRVYEYLHPFVLGVRV